MKLQLKRTFKQADQVQGTLQVFDHNETAIFTAVTLEPAYNNNTMNKSAIPVGIYSVVKRWSVKYGHHFWIQNVPNRSMILIHGGNYRKDTKGCIIVGIYITDINSDNLQDVALSGQTMGILNYLLPDKFTLTIS